MQFIIRSKIDPQLQKHTDHIAGVYNFLWGRSLDHWQVLYEKEVDLSDCNVISDIVEKLTDLEK